MQVACGEVDLVCKYANAKIDEVLDLVVKAHFGSLAQLVRAFASHAKGRWFESSKIHKNATIDGGVFLLCRSGAHLEVIL